MRILHYLHGLPPVRKGGLIKYALDLAEGEQKAGNEIHLMVPGRFETRRSKGKTRIKDEKWETFPCHYVINPLLVTEGMRIDRMEGLTEQGDIEVYAAFLKKLCPDVIHVHSLMGIHLSFFQAAERLSVPVIVTTHDYYGLCPKITLLRKGKTCREQDWKMCAQCMGISVSEKRLKRKHFIGYRLMKQNRLYQWMEYAPVLLPYKRWVRERLGSIKGKSKGGEKKVRMDRDAMEAFEALRAYYLQICRKITCFHFNSTQTREIYRSFLGNVKGTVLPITNKSVADHRRIRTCTGKLKIGYLSSGTEFKGYFHLTEILDAMYRGGRTEFECHVYFNSQETNRPYLYHHPPYKEEDREAVFGSMDLLAAPSIWKETFGMVVLEALSYGVPVLVSSNVGAGELLEKNPGMGAVLHVEKLKEELQEMLERIYDDREILSEMNARICRWEWNWDYSAHVREMLRVYENL